MRLLERRGPVRRALEVADEMLANPALGQERRASWLQQRGRLTAHFGDPNRAQDDLREAQSWGRTLGDVDLEINATNWLGIAKASSGDHEGALTCFHEALAVAEAHDLAQHVAFINGGIAGSSKYLGDLKKSRHHYETALAGHRALGNDRGIALVQGDLGLVDLAEKDYATAKARIVEAIEILARQNNPVSEAVGWHELAQVYQAQELYDDAREALQTALERLRRTGATLHEVYLLRMLADLEREATGLEAASAWMEEALGVARDLDVPGAVYSTLRQLAAIRRAQGSPQQAERLEAQADQLEAEDQASRTV